MTGGISGPALIVGVVSQIQGAPILLDVEPDCAYILFQHEVARSWRHATGVEQHERRADGRVAGEVHLFSRRKDPQSRRAVGSGGRLHEDRFGQAHFAGNALHHRGVESGGVGKHCQRIAFASVFGEYVDHAIPDLLHGREVYFVY